MPKGAETYLGEPRRMIEEVLRRSNSLLSFDTWATYKTKNLGEDTQTAKRSHKPEKLLEEDTQTTRLSHNIHKN